MKIPVHCECTESEFNLHPSDMRRQKIEATLEGVSIDHSDGDYEGRDRQVHENLINSDPNQDPY